LIYFTLPNIRCLSNLTYGVERVMLGKNTMNIYIAKTVPKCIWSALEKWNHFQLTDWDGTYSKEFFVAADVLILSTVESKKDNIFSRLKFFSRQKVLLIVCSEHFAPRPYLEANDDPTVASTITVIEYKSDPSDIQSHVLSAINLHHVALQINKP